MYALGDCSYQETNPLPATAQVASQQGAYLGRLFSKGYYMDAPAPIPLYKVLDTSMYGQREEAIDVNNGKVSLFLVFTSILHSCFPSTGTQIGKFLEATNFIKTTKVSH